MGCGGSEAAILADVSFETAVHRQPAPIGVVPGKHERLLIILFGPNRLGYLASLPGESTPAALAALRRNHSICSGGDMGDSIHAMRMVRSSAACRPRQWPPCVSIDRAWRRCCCGISRGVSTWVLATFFISESIRARSGAATQPFEYAFGRIDPQTGTVLVTERCAGQTDQHTRARQHRMPRSGAKPRRRGAANGARLAHGLRPSRRTQLRGNRVQHFRTEAAGNGLQLAAGVACVLDLADGQNDLDIGKAAGSSVAGCPSSCPQRDEWLPRRCASVPVRGAILMTAALWSSGYASPEKESGVFPA